MQPYRITVFCSGCAEGDDEFMASLAEAEALWVEALTNPRFGKVILGVLQGNGTYKATRVAEREAWVVREVEASSASRNIAEFGFERVKASLPSFPLAPVAVGA